MSESAAPRGFRRLPPGRLRAPPFDDGRGTRGLPPPYDRLHAEAATFIPVARLVTDPLRLLTWGTDASFYRLIPKIVVVVASESELVRLLELCARLSAPLTFRAAGTSLSGQAISDSVLVMLGDEGNADLSAHLPKLYIASVGIEKVLPRTEHLVRTSAFAVGKCGTSTHAGMIFTQRFRGTRRDSAGS